MPRSDSYDDRILTAEEAIRFSMSTDPRHFAFISIKAPKIPPSVVGAKKLALEQFGLSVFSACFPDGRSL